MTPPLQREINDALRALCSPDAEAAKGTAAWTKSDFLLACAFADMGAVKSFLAENPALACSRGGPDGWEPIEYACFSRWTVHCPDLQQDLVEIVRLLLQNGANPSASHLIPENEAWPQTVLYASSGILNCPNLVELLLTAGADINESLPEPDPDDPLKSPWGPEALYHTSEFRDTTCLKLLLEAGPRPLYVSYCLARALDFENPAAIDLFLHHGADPNFRVPWAGNRGHLHRAVLNGRSAAIAGLILKAGGDPLSEDSRGITAYRDAVRYGRAEIQALFEAHGCHAATETDFQLGRLMRGEKEGDHPDLIDPALMRDAARRNEVQAMKALAGAGADLDASEGEMPPLHEAAWWGKFAAVQFLVEAGADLNLPNRYGGDALATAIHGSENCLGSGDSIDEAGNGTYPEIVELLIRAGSKVPERLVGSSGVRAVLVRYGVETCV